MPLPVLAPRPLKEPHSSAYASPLSFSGYPLCFPTPTPAGSPSSPPTPPGAVLANSAVCVQEIKLNLLAKSCLCPGLTALVHNLVMSHNSDGGRGGGSGDGTQDEDRSAEGGGVDQVVGMGASSPAPTSWMREYSDGCEYEIYRVALTPAFEGLSFTEASNIVFSESNMVLFALEIAVPSADKSVGPRVVLNPGAFILPGVPFLLHAFVIATDKREAEVIAQVGIGRVRKPRLAEPASSSSAGAYPGDGGTGEAGAEQPPIAVAIKLAIDALKVRWVGKVSPGKTTGCTCSTPWPHPA